MALSQEERQIAERLKSRGYTTNEVAGYIGGLRSNSPSTISFDLEKEVPEEEKEGAMERITGAIKDAPSDIAEGFKGVGEQAFSAGENIVETATDKNLTFGEKLRGVGGDLFRGIGRTVGEAGLTALKLPFSQRQEGRIKEKATDIAQKVVETEPVRAVIEEYEALPEDAKREIKNALGFVEGVAEVATVGTAGKIVREGVDLTGDAINQLKNQVKELDIPKRPTANDFPEAKGVVRDLIDDVKPKSDEVRDRLIAKSLKLAPVEDIARIEGVTGENIGDFMGRYNLIADTADETVEGLARFKQQNIDRVSDAISLVDESYSPNEIAGFVDTTNFLKKQLGDLSSNRFKTVVNQIDTIQGKEVLDLNDVLTVRKMADELTSFYKRSGDVKDSLKAQDMAENINEMRRFLETEVKAQYPDIDIKALNNNIRTSSELLDAVLKRSGKNDTESLFKLGDMAILGAGNVTAPGAGFAGLVAKKTFESPAIQLRLARTLDSKIDRSLNGKLTASDLDELDELLQSELFKSLDSKEQIEAKAVIDSLKQGKVSNNANK